MSNVNIGFVDGRMGSRILKPPGGGYSEIFFTDEECKPKKAPQTRTESMIESILRTEEVVAKKTETKSEVQTEMKDVLEEKIQNLSFEEHKEEIDGKKEEEFEEKSEPTTPEPKIPEEPKTPEPTKTPEVKSTENTPRRTRVPPGGFSSALW